MHIKELKEKASKGPFEVDCRVVHNRDGMIAGANDPLRCGMELDYGDANAQLIAHCLNNFGPLLEDADIALSVATDCPELNMSNYSHDDVALLNTAMCEVYAILNNALKEASEVTV